MPRYEGPVTAEHHAIGADLVEQEAKRLLAADHAVVVEAALIRTRRLLDDAKRVGGTLPAAVEAPHREARRPAAVGDAHLQGGARVEDAAEDQHRDDDRVLDDDAEAVEEAVAGRALHHEVVLRLRMEEEHGPHGLRRP